MTISVLEGTIVVTVKGISRTVPAGALVRIPLDNDLHPTGSSSLPEPYNAENLATQPVNYLPTQIAIAPPLSVTPVLAQEDLKITDEVDDTFSCSAPDTLVSDSRADIKEVDLMVTDAGVLQLYVTLGERVPDNNVDFYGVFVEFYKNGEQVQSVVLFATEGRTVAGIEDLSTGTITLPETGMRAGIDRDAIQIRWEMSPPHLISFDQVGLFAVYDELGDAEGVCDLVDLIDFDVQIVTLTCEISIASNVNLRGGPSTNFDVVNTLQGGQSVTADGQATGPEGFIWWRLEAGGWVRSDIVSVSNDCETIPVVEP